MTKVAILGATSHVAKGLIFKVLEETDFTCDLYVRNAPAMEAFLQSLGPQANERMSVLLVDSFAAGGGQAFADQAYDMVFNAIGVGDPAGLQRLGSGIFALTESWENRILDALESAPDTLYIYLSSGAVYGSDFSQAANQSSEMCLAINEYTTQRHYGIAKLNAEAKHRAFDALNIVDLRIFSYFSRFQDLSARFLISELIACLREERPFKTNNLDLIRDYVTPDDFFRLIMAVWTHHRQSKEVTNMVLDVYSQAPVGKFDLLDGMADAFGLNWSVDESLNTVTATGAKNVYCSQWQEAAKYGYQPQQTALEGLISETRVLLGRV